MTTTEITALTAPTRFARAADGVTYAYRRFGGASDVPLLMLQHFRGNIDNWDPAFIDALAAEREVILVDYAGVSSSTGLPAHTVAETARQVIAFADAIGLTRTDLLGFSLGGFAAQDVALTRPALVRRLVLAGTGPQGAPGTHGWRQDIAGHARRGQPRRRGPALHLLRPHRDQPGERGGVPRPVPAAGRGPRHGEQPRRPRRPV
jgi:pimeloyl-ACP methyl ester carboxylesterase